MAYGVTINNPGNLRPFKNNFYLGQNGLADNGEAIFSSLLYGLRALAMDLNIKIDKDGLTTIQDIAEVYAPDSDGNNSNEYARTVAQYSGIGVNDYLVSDGATIAKLMRGIITAENGQAKANTITYQDIQNGIALYDGSNLVSSSGNVLLLVGFGILLYKYLK